MNTISKLQFKHHNEVITGNTLSEARAAVMQYITDQWYEQNAPNEPQSGYRSLFAEPTVFRYSVEGEEENAHVILLIGAATNDSNRIDENKFCVIDIDKTEQEIADLQAELEAAIKSLTLVALSSDTLNFYAEKTEDGTLVSGDVKVADSYIFDNVRKNNNLMVTSDGLFIYVNMSYDEENETFTFTVSNADGTLTETSVKLPNNYVVSGYYSKRDESIHLILKDGQEVLINCEKIIAEWGVEGDASKTPVVLTKEEVYYDNTDEHHHVEPWQDILRADVRLKDEQKILQPDGTYKYVKDENSINILDRTTDGRYLYVDGKASNIIYYMDGEKSTVKAALDKLVKIKLSSDNDNIVIERPDGFFASAKLEYISNQNTLVFKASGQEEKRIQLNSIELFENVYYDPTREVLVLTYKDSKGETQFVEIPIGEMIRDWEWDVQNEGHDIKLTKVRHVSGNDKLSADAKIYNDPDNILVDKNHELFVKGTADNIKYENGTVKGALDDIKTSEAVLDAKIDQEIANREAADTILENKIGTGFTDDPHENVTAKFESLNDKIEAETERATNAEAELGNNITAETERATAAETALDEKIDAEITRSTEKDTEHDGRLDAIDEEIGDGFGPRNTIKDEFDKEKTERENADQALQDEIEAVSADSANSLKDIVNVDESINIDKTDATKPVISVNLSEEVEHGKENIIKLNADGLYAGVDLAYEGTANKLIFTTTNGSKEIQLESMSSIISIEYNPTKEAIVITYMTNGHEVKTVEIPVGDLINEWRVEDGHPHAVELEKVRIASGTSEQDVLKASVIITDDHDDNILVMDDGALYVPANTDVTDALAAAINAETTRAISADTKLNNKIDAETTRATLEEGRIEAKLDSEITRSTTRDTELSNNIDREVERATNRENSLNDAITAETLRAQAADNELYTKIADEKSAREINDSVLDSKIDTEKSRAQVIENILSGMIATETVNRENADNNLSSAISTEISERQTAVEELRNLIGEATLTFEDTKSVDFTKDENNKVFANVKLANAPDNIILIDDVKEGLYTSVDLDYESATNKIKFTVNGVEKDFTIAAGSILEDAWYDSVTKNLVFKTKTASGEYVEITVPAYDLFDEWYPQQPVSGTALSLTLTTGRTDPTTHEPLPNILSGSVLISPLEDNLLMMDTNGLYVPSNGVEEAECANKKADKLYNLLYGEGSAMAGCGENTSYVRGTGCIISAATSFSEADQMLNDAFCQFMDNWEVYGFDTPSTHTDWLKIGQNRHMLVDVRLSHGVNAYESSAMTDDDLTISDFMGDYIEPTVSGFSDTNVLRIVNITQSKSGEPLEANNKYNGVYLSNSWDCGLYYGNTEADIAAKAAAEASGYITDYNTDEDESASNYNYMNNVRQHDI